MDGGSKDLELERLQAILRDNILTSEVKRNGIGTIDRRGSNARSTGRRRIQISEAAAAADILMTNFCHR